MIVVKLIYAIFFIASGLGLIRYRRNVKQWTGNFYWAEKYLGNGGTYLLLVLFGLFLIFFGVIYPFGGFTLLFSK